MCMRLVLCFTNGLKGALLLKLTRIKGCVIKYVCLGYLHHGGWVGEVFLLDIRYGMSSPRQSRPIIVGP